MNAVPRSASSVTAPAATTIGVPIRLAGVVVDAAEEQLQRRRAGVRHPLGEHALQAGD